jgi:hypothetical protein
VRGRKQLLFLKNHGCEKILAPPFDFRVSNERPPAAAVSDDYRYNLTKNIEREGQLARHISDNIGSKAFAGKTRASRENMMTIFKYVVGFERAGMNYARVAVARKLTSHVQAMSGAALG